MRVYTEAQKEARRVRRRLWWANNSEQYRANQKKWREANKERIRGWKLRQKYGLTLEQEREMFAAQGNTSAICRRIDSFEKHVDHDHETGKVRGILCPQCNAALGQFRDKASSLYRAIEYLWKASL